MSWWWWIGLAWVIALVALRVGIGFGDTLKRQPLDQERKNG